jgi:hypothetical protein
MLDKSAAQNVLTALRRLNLDVKDHADSVDLAKTYTTQFAQKAWGA